LQAAEAARNEETKMAQNATSQLIWYRKPFGRRLANRQHPYFSISPDADTVDADGSRRRALAARAGL
jgi:hypothetical protein